ncbi:MAG: DUF2975 domain-containing protein, partial [Sphingomonadales bacterium]|nr:DUF2975 domain-containing protein [Sphingomonadales bacterium]
MSIHPPRDPLLGIARLGTSVLMALFAIAAGAVAFAAVVLLAVPAFLRDALIKGQLHLQLSDAAPEITVEMLTPGFFAMVGAMLVIVAAMLVAAFQFVRLLRRIVDSVGAGDPFSPANATRLAEMGWLLVGIELAAVPLQALGEWIGTRVHEPGL